MNNYNKVKTPMLLAPAGSYDALCAAIDAGCDEVYFGMQSFNARNGAKNFSEDEFKSAVSLCRVMGVSSNITVNTLLLDRELCDVLDMIYGAACLGADAFIIQDTALPLLVREQMPQVVMHASTQCACHNRAGAEYLHDAGFSRIVLARELSGEDIAAISENAPYETEMFVHGALCVCHSGQCLFSSVVGGRSGNRGMCAQPCRMQYALSGEKGKKSGYTLSLKDLSLAKHITEITKLGVQSLKLEGRMKSPEYVYGVTKTFRTLLDENRNATDDEMKYLYELFSRDGFTDGYYTKKYLSSGTPMYGVRSEKEKELTRLSEEKIRPILRTPAKSISAVCSFEIGKKPCLSLLCGDISVCVSDDAVIEKAKNAPSDFDSVAKNLTKFGGTLFSLDKSDISMSLSENAFVPAGLINNLRRNASDALLSALTSEIPIMRARSTFRPIKNEECEKEPALRLYFGQPEGFSEKMKTYEESVIDGVLFPLAAFTEKSRDFFEDIAKKYKLGILFPRVLFEDENDGAKAALLLAKSMGAVFCEVSNIGHIKPVREAGLEVIGGIGLNIANSKSAEYYTDVLGLNSIVLSPEIKPGAIRDIVKKEGKSYCLFARGRLPLMVLESCVIKAGGLCGGKCGLCGTLSDRTSAVFPICAEKRFSENAKPCRNIIYNSVITDLTEKEKIRKCGLDVLCICAEKDGLPI